jgi:pseudoazurin
MACVLAHGMAASTAEAAEHLVRMLTDSAQGRFQFVPAIVMIEPGDDVRFVPDTHMHAVKSTAATQPEGAPRGWGRMGEAIVVRLEQPGVYGFKCAAHYQIGMVGMIIVGREPPNWQAAKAVRHPPMPTAAFNLLFAKAACRLGAAYRAECRE